MSGQIAGVKATGCDVKVSLRNVHEVKCLTLHVYCCLKVSKVTNGYNTSPVGS